MRKVLASLALIALFKEINGNSFKSYQPYALPKQNTFSVPKFDNSLLHPQPISRRKKVESIKKKEDDNIIYGVPGMDGRPGRDGKNGEQGERGSIGAKGKIGPKGDKGDRGKPGLNGDDGKPGAIGAPGRPGKSKSGIIGPKGDRGKPGKPGHPGKNGINGKPGKPGLVGLKGDKGKNGKNGLQGKPGLKGDKGYTGRPGKQGPPGPPGKARSAGRPGPPGPPGPPGDCICNKKKHRNPLKPKRSIKPVKINTGINYDEYFGNNNNNYGSPKSLSGKAAHSQPYYIPPVNDKNLPKRFDDGYDPKKHSQYNFKLPKNSLISSLGKKEHSGVGGIKKLPVRSRRGNKYDEEKKFKNAKINDKKSEVLVDTDRERKQELYNDNLDYAGKEIYEDAKAAEQRYKKGEAYENEKDIAQRKDSLYGGDALYQQDKVSTNGKVAFEVDHSLRFKNDYNDENHRGQYKGDEFDVSYKASDIQGGYSAKELDREKKSAAYKGLNAKGEFAEAGKVYDDNFDKYGKDDKDLRYRDKQYGNVKLPGKSAGVAPPPRGVPQSGSLYDKFKGINKGKSSGPIYTKGHIPDGQYGKNGYKTFYPYGERLKVKKDQENEDKYRAHGNNFEGKDYYQDRQEAEAYSGQQDKLKEKLAFDKGQYRDVAAKGKNKQASYAGDYQTNKKSQNVDFNVKHFEDLKQDLQQDVKSDQYYAKYEGEDNKFVKEADNKFGKYTDAESKRKQDALINAKRYNGNDNSKFAKVEDEAKIYLKSKNDAIRESELKAKPEGYRGEDKRPRRYSRYGNRYGPRRYSDNKRGDENDRRRLMFEINELEAKISSINLRNISTTKDIILISIIIILAAFFGALTFIGIMNITGYKVKKVVKKSQDVETLLQN